MSNRSLFPYKSIEPTHYDYLRRPHIHNLLEKAFEKSAAVIIAGAGYGKTQAVYAYLQENDVVTIWQQLTKYDNLPVRLWENLVYAASLQNEKLAKRMEELGFPESMASYHKFLDLLSEETQGNKKHVIVYDDFYLIHEKSVFDFFENFITANIPNLSIVLISRVEPEINIIGLLSKGLVAQITEYDFRFTEHEMNQYFEMLGIQISPKMNMEIYNYTDGWIFAINLVALSLKKGQIKENYAILAVKENVDRLLDKEVFSYLSKGTQEVLLQLSLLNDTPVELLKALFPNSDHFIAELSRINSFVRYDAFSDTFRIHHLFLRFLHKRQFSIPKEKLEIIYRTAAEWYLNNGFTIDAISLYEKICDYDNIFEIAMRFPFRWPKETAAYIIELMDRIPEESMEKKPLLKILYSRILVSLDKYKESGERLIKLKIQYEALPASAENSVILCELYILLGIFETMKCFSTGTLGMTEQLYKKALELCPNGSEISKNLSMNLSPYISMVGISCDFTQVLEEQKRVAIYHKKLLNGIAYGAAELGQGEYYFFRKDMKNAEKCTLLSIGKTLEAKQFHIENMAHFYLLRCYMAAGNYTKVNERIYLLKLRTEEQNHPDSHIMFDIVSGWFYSVIGETSKVARWIKDDIGISGGTLSSSIFGLDILTRVRCCLVEEKYNEILTFLESPNAEYLNLFLLGQIETTVIKAICLYYTREHDAAIVALQTAYKLALPNLFIMPFVEQGSGMRTLANAALNDENCIIPKQWLEEIRTMSSSYSKRLNQIKREYQIEHQDNNTAQLTKRETAILSDICRGLTREEISLEQNLSINTVKSMLTNVFLKLGAINTADAIRIAVENKLLK